VCQIWADLGGRTGECGGQKKGEWGQRNKAKATGKNPSGNEGGLFGKGRCGWKWGPGDEEGSPSTLPWDPKNEKRQRLGKKTYGKMVGGRKEKRKAAGGGL